MIPVGRWFGSVVILGFTLAAVGLPLATGCGGSQQPRAATVPPSVLAPVVITTRTYSAAVRTYHRLAHSDPRREHLRQRLIDHLSGLSQAVLQADDYELVVEHLAALTSLYTPEEMASAPLTGALRPLADYLIKHGSPRGDEARVLSGLLIKRRLTPHQPALAAQYARLARWTREVRAALSGLDRFDDGLVEAWEEHARLTPTPEILQALANLYIERRDAYLHMERSPEIRRLLMRGARQNSRARVEGTALRVAGLYLRHGNPAAALSTLERITTATPFETELIRTLRNTRSPDERWMALQLVARLYLAQGLPSVSEGLCRMGIRESARNAGFAKCLARVATARKDYAGATAWYSEAIESAPNARALYDEALQELSRLIEERLYDTDATSTRQLARHAGKILEERMHRWPGSPPPIAPERLYLALGVAEMNGGNARAAEQRLNASVRAKVTLDALLQLGLLAERTERPAEALGLYERALRAAENKLQQATKDRDRRGRTGGRRWGRDATELAIQHVEIVEHLADALRKQGHINKATARYAAALQRWDELAGTLEGPALAKAHIHRGIIYSRLGQKRQSIASFEAALRAAPADQATYAAVLSHMVTTGSDSRLAHSVFHRALNKIALDPEWKVYFALWVHTIAGRSGYPVEREVREVLQDLSEGQPWWARLASFWLGKISYRDLLSFASGVGQRTEAHFYEAARRLARGDDKGAIALLRVVLDGRMVSFFEHTMSLELLERSRPQRHTPASLAVPSPSAVPPTPPVPPPAAIRRAPGTRPRSLHDGT